MFNTLLFDKIPEKLMAFPSASDVLCVSARYQTINMMGNLVSIAEHRILALSVKKMQTRQTVSSSFYFRNRKSQKHSHPVGSKPDVIKCYQTNLIILYIR